MEQRVSVIMCTYNGALYLQEQLDSIINQTCPIYELIIQDDCSTDGTWPILEEYAKKYSFIRIFRNEKNEGVNRNFFSAIKKASGNFVAISDQDDIWELDKLQTQVKGIGNNMLSFGFSCPFASGNVQIHFDNRVPNCAIERMLYTGVTPGHTILVTRAFLELFFDIPNIEKANVTYDRLLSLVAAAYRKIQFCNKILVHSRRHINAATYTPPNDYHKNFINILKSVARTFRLYQELRPLMRIRFGEMYRLLKTFPNDAPYKKDAQKLAYWHSQSSFGSYIKLTELCLRLRHKIFYVDESNILLSILRALYFPISCSDYFRYLSKNYHK